MGIIIAWLTNWFLFWGMLPWLVNTPFPKKVLGVSVILALVLGSLLMKGSHGSEDRFFRILHPLARAIQFKVLARLAKSLFPLFIANVLLALALN